MEQFLESLSEVQKDAVTYCDGPLLILAGAGSGKTRVLCHKVMYLINNLNIDPNDILSVTFTNKAANEMKERIYSLLKIPTWSMWVSTFHSVCMRILRAHAEYLGYTKNFVVYDDRDQQKIIKESLAALEIDSEQIKPRSVQYAINGAKNNLISPENMQAKALSLMDKKIANIYAHYQESLQKNDAMDFGDLIFNVNSLFKHNDKVLKEYQEKFKYILVDEYQDTNDAQYSLLKMLASAHKNICVVGDDDQSIVEVELVR
ncbi:ATP-dependent helicase, partial [Thermodesulfobacteriota bacterium]